MNQNALKDFLNLNTLKKYRESLQYDIDDLIKKFPKIEAWERGEVIPTIRQLEDLAHKYNLESFSKFIIDYEEPDFPKDFRPQFRNFTGFEANEIKAINNAIEKRNIYLSFLKDLKEEPLKTLNFQNKTDPSKLAQEFKQAINFNYKDKNYLDDPFNFFKKRIENLGILIFTHDWNPHFKVNGFEGVALYYEPSPIILLVSQSDDGKGSKRRMLFTLLHETAHILRKENALVEKELNISNDREEVFCNQFVEHLLIPDINDFSPSIDIENYVQKHINSAVSEPLVIYRLFHADKITPEQKDRLYASYQKRYNSQSSKLSKTNESPHISSLTRATYFYSKSYLKTIYNAYQEDIITLADIYRYTKVKPHQVDELARRIFNDR